MWGKVILGGVGAVLGGPIGAGIGVALGEAFFDSSSNPQVQSSSLPPSSQNELSAEEEAQIAVFFYFFASLAKIAKADGQVTQKEIQSIEEIIKEMNLAEEERKLAIEIFREAKDDNNASASECINQLASAIQYDPQVGYSFFTLFCRVTLADGFVSDVERQILLEAERALRLQPGTINAFVKTSMSLQKAYDLLGCDERMNDSEIKCAYRKKCIDFHPDRLNSRGLPPEFIKFANEQMTQLHEAYEIISSSRIR